MRPEPPFHFRVNVQDIECRLKVDPSCSGTRSVGEKIRWRCTLLRSMKIKASHADEPSVLRLPETSSRTKRRRMCSPEADRQDVLGTLARSNGNAEMCLASIFSSSMFLSYNNSSEPEEIILVCFFKQDRHIFPSMIPEEVRAALTTRQLCQRVQQQRPWPENPDSPFR